MIEATYSKILKDSKDAAPWCGVLTFNDVLVDIKRELWKFHGPLSPALVGKWALNTSELRVANGYLVSTQTCRGWDVLAPRVKAVLAEYFFLEHQRRNRH